MMYGSKYTYKLLMCFLEELREKGFFENEMKSFIN